MAHFAELDNDNTVLRVIVVDNSVLQNSEGQEEEIRGIDFCKSIFGNDTKWVQTSYNCSFRRNYAGPGYKYYELQDVFIPPQPYPSWILNNDTLYWEPPIPHPTDGGSYYWDEDAQSWQPIEI